MERKNIPLDDLRQRYLAGESEKALAEFYNVSRPVIRRRLLELGIQPRNRAEGMVARMARTTPEERSRMSAAAHDAVRGMKRSPEDLARRARGKEASQVHIGGGEVMLGEWLRARGISFVPQKAVGPYNIDLAIRNLAVEVHVRSGNPSRVAHYVKRSEYLLNLGRDVIYVWINAGFFLNERAADEIVAMLKITKGLPSGARQYRVIRGTGETVLSIGFDKDQVAVIPTAKATRKRSGSH